MTWVVLPVVLYAGIVVLVYLLQDRLVFFPARTLETDPSACGMAFEDVDLVAADGTRMHGWYLPCEGGRGTAIFCHGNGGNISHRLEVLRDLHRLGLATLIFDYPGYGRSGGRPTEAGMYAAAAAAWRHLTRTRGVPAAKILLWGRSLGGAVAIELATRVDPAGLVVESSLTSVVDLAARHYWWLPVRRLCRYRFDSVARVPRIPCPKLFVHSRDDDIVPFALGRALYDAAREPKRFVEITGGHDSGPQTSGARYLRPVGDFVRDVLGGG